jgi:hypothetical protein
MRASVRRWLQARLTHDLGFYAEVQDLMHSADIAHTEQVEASRDRWLKTPEGQQHLLLLDWELALDEDRLVTCERRAEIHKAKGWNPCYRYGPKGETLAQVYLDALSARGYRDGADRSPWVSYTTKEKAEQYMELAESMGVADELKHYVRRVALAGALSLALILDGVSLAALQRQKATRLSDEEWERGE